MCGSSVGTPSIAILSGDEGDAILACFSAELAPGECLVKIVHRGSSHMQTTSHPFPRASTAMPPQVSSRAYRTIKYSNTSTGNWIIIPGAGGGLGHLVQYAR
ncbi:hypothetical protein B0H17DRAFT_1223228, partial [Mycena rosella]